jgi:molybdate transport system ATP-binding protein
MAPGLTAAFRKRHGAFALDLAIELPAGVTALVGPSGSGKTTAIRCLAGLERPDRGRILMGNATWFDGERRIHVSPQARRVGFVFNDFALFPHLTVEKNVAFGAARAARVGEALTLLDIESLRDRRPSFLSAGQQQRVALARAIASDPQLLLLDEPFSSLDTSLKERLYGEFARLLATLDIPVAIVTHDLREASLLASRMVVLDQGHCAQIGTPREVYFKPASQTVSELAGIRNNFEGVTVEKGIQWGPHRVKCVTGRSDGRPVGWCIRPELVRLLPPDFAEAGGLPGEVTEVALAGPTYRVRVDVPGAGTVEASVELDTGDRLGLTVGMPVALGLPASAVHLFADV